MWKTSSILLLSSLPQHHLFHVHHYRCQLRLLHLVGVWHCWWHNNDRWMNQWQYWPWNMICLAPLSLPTTFTIVGVWHCWWHNNDWWMNQWQYWPCNMICLAICWVDSIEVKEVRIEWVPKSWHVLGVLCIFCLPTLWSSLRSNHCSCNFSEFPVDKYDIDGACVIIG